MKAIIIVLGSVLLLALHASTSVAQVPRTFVSGLGNDGNPCSRTAPCRTFGQAITGTSSGGEVIALDSAGYGPFTISQAVSIIAPPGVYAGISVFSGNGITINAGASDTVILRGLTVNSQGSTGDGIVFNSGGTLHVENCTLSGGTSTKGLLSLGGTTEVKDTVVRGYGAGILITGISMGVVDHVRLEGNITGLAATNGAKVTVRNSVSCGNQGTGFLAFCDSLNPAELNIENCVASNNPGIGVGTLIMGTIPPTVRISGSTVTDNGTGLRNNGGALLSRGNNTVEGNVTDTTGTIGSYTAK